MRIGFALCSLVAAGAIAALATRGGWVRWSEPSLVDYPVRGIDISHHQGVIDWHAVRRAGVGFAYMKASEGGDLRDPRFAANWAGASRAGIQRGAYHFFTFCTPAEPQARNFLAIVPRDGPMLPPAIDVEFVGNCARPPDAESIRAQLGILVARLAESFGAYPVLYVTEDSYERVARGVCAACPLWARDTFGTPVLADGAAWTIWQHSGTGRVDGISGDVDLDVFRVRAALIAAPAR